MSKRNEAPSKGRAAGILLHPTSLPSAFGIGDLGPSAHAFVDALVRAKQTWWQVLPLGPTAYGDSPYQCTSAFGGNPNLISPELLVRDGLVSAHDLDGDHLSDEQVDYAAVIAYKTRVLAKAWDNFQAGTRRSLQTDFEAFCERQGAWLEDIALFLALKTAHGGVHWLEWPRKLVERDRAALQDARSELAPLIGAYRFQQFLFFRQWDALKQYAHAHGVGLIGDLPIFVAGDSVDVWAHPDLFLLDENQAPTVVAGVPPDYFSSTGQLWGNPLYDWQSLKSTGYAWWQARLRATLEQVDLVRLDHFRGFEAYWEVPAGMPTAEVGRWVKAPGQDLLGTLQKALGKLPVIAEDLGVITPEVDALRNHFDLPGMRILQFAFGGAQEDRFLPHNHERRTVVYTGTHDNNTTRGWYESLTERETKFLHRYAPMSNGDVSWDMIRLAWASVAELAVAPLQDVLSLGSEARLNRPGQPTGNWRWRFPATKLTNAVLDRLADLTDLYGR